MSDTTTTACSSTHFLQSLPYPEPQRALRGVDPSVHTKQQCDVSKQQTSGAARRGEYLGGVSFREGNVRITRYNTRYSGGSRDGGTVNTKRGEGAARARSTPCHSSPTEGRLQRRELRHCYYFPFFPNKKHAFHFRDDVHRSRGQTIKHPLDDRF